MMTIIDAPLIPITIIAATARGGLWEAVGALADKVTSTTAPQPVQG
jgi:hypothetical protein